MRLDDAPESDNVEDQRGSGGGTRLAIGGAGGVLLVILGLIFGVDFRGGGPGPAGPGGPPDGGGHGAPPDPETKHFAQKVLGTLEAVWEREFEQHHAEYRVRWESPKLVLFSDGVQTGCGNAPSSVGPFYCPADKRLYVDPTFFDELKQFGGSKAEFSQAYVIAHEVGHHVQNLLGYSTLVDRHRNDLQYSVRLELMADYLAGVWANKGQKQFNFIEKGDVDEAIRSANSIGDDRLQKRGGGFAHPEKYTHGTSRQRVHFFTKGLETGDASKATLDKFFDVRNTPMDRNGEIRDF